MCGSPVLETTLDILQPGQQFRTAQLALLSHALMATSDLDKLAQPPSKHTPTLLCLHTHFTCAVKTQVNITN